MIPKYRFFYERKINEVINLHWTATEHVFVTIKNKHEVLVNIKDGHLMQWTGLVDLNGVEVFEGDIINTPHADYDGCHIWQVEFNGCEFSGRSIKDPAWRRILTHTDIEVIGNIHLNPELLEGAERE